MATIITGTGSYIPGVVISNSSFKEHSFYGEDGVKTMLPTKKYLKNLKTLLVSMKEGMQKKM